MPRFEPADLSEYPLDELIALLDLEFPRDVRDALAPIEDQRLYALALAIGSHATSVYVTANTEEHLRATVPTDEDPSDPYWRWDCCGDWAVIAPDVFPETNAFLFELDRSHQAWLWSFDRDERVERSAQTFAVLRSRLVGVFHDAVRNLTEQHGIGQVDHPPCVCLLDLGSPEFTRWSARQLSASEAFDREFGSSLERAD